MTSGYRAAPVYEELRKRVLSLTPAVVGSSDRTAVLAVLMDVGQTSSAVTLVTVAGGGASLYESTGGGIIGAGELDKPRRESQRMLRVAEPLVGRMDKVTSFPLPERNHTRFYVVTRNGVYAADALEEELREGRHDLSPLFVQGQRVIAAIREVQERTGSGQG